MNDIVIAVIAFTGTAFGSICGILQANKLVMYRLQQLEKKVQEHNNLISRTYNLEKYQETSELKFDNIEKEIDELKGSI